MARKKNVVDEFYNLLKINPKQAIIILIIAGLAYFLGGEGIFLNDAGNDAGNQDFVAGIIVRAVDGDTAVVRVDGQERRVRLLGVDTPETVHPNKPVQFYGKEASNFTKESLNGKRVWLANPKTINESTIRENMFNARLLLGGYAKVMIIKPNKRYEAEFKKFEAEARQAKLGVWSQ